MKNPTLAAGLSLLLPGLGQAYNGRNQMWKGILFLALAYVWHRHGHTTAGWTVAGLALTFWAMADAYKSAKRINAVRTAGRGVIESYVGGITKVINQTDEATYDVATVKGPLTGVWETFVTDGTPERIANVYVVTPDQMTRVPPFAKNKIVPVVKSDEAVVAALHRTVALWVQKNPRFLWQDLLVVSVHDELAKLGYAPPLEDRLRLMR